MKATENFTFETKLDFETMTEEDYFCETKECLVGVEVSYKWNCTEEPWDLNFKFFCEEDLTGQEDYLENLAEKIFWENYFQN